jgi:hypothetical protein
VAETPAEVSASVHDYRADVLGEAFRRRRPERSSSPGLPPRDGPRLAAVEDDPS